MHLLAVQPGRVDDGSAAVDLGQTPGEIVILSTADSELACLARARAGLPAGFPALRLANLLQLKHNLSVDLYVEQVIAGARLVCIRLLGGRSYWPYGIDEIAECCRARGIALALLPGDAQDDPDFAVLSTLDEDARARLQAYGDHGGVPNARNLLLYAAALAGRADGLPAWQEPQPLLSAGLYWPGLEGADLAAIAARWQDGAPVAALVFYRALMLSGGTATPDALVAGLQAEGLNPLPVFVQSLKDEAAGGLLARLFAAHPPAVIVNATGFAVSVPGGAAGRPPGGADCPVLQAVLAAGDRDGWAAGSAGLTARDMAMNVALPEVDGRIFTRAIAFKAAEEIDPATQWPVTGHVPEPDRIAFVAALAARWARLRRTAPADRRVALVLANYPNRDGRLGNGVGLDTPASAVAVLQAMAGAGYPVADLPGDGDALMRRLSAGPTNAARRDRSGGAFLPLAAYQAFFAGLPAGLRRDLTARWGAPEADPFFGRRDGAVGFVLPVLMLGNVAIAIQPARGYNIDPQASYHDPALVPPHGYLAFYAWLRGAFDAHAVVHLGKHGNLEWLPGKALALSAGCYPEAALGPLPHLYPFIVNDPGEGSQAKRRAAAVIVDHLTPPLTRAESYGPLKDLEALVDEYYDAAQGDPRRVAFLRREILGLAAAIGLDRDLEAASGPGAAGAAQDGEDGALARLDAYLCELKELQIRDGLHVFGRAPEGRQCRDLLVALTRLPRGHGRDGQASLLRALAADLGLGDWDPLDAALGDAWDGPRPAALADLLPAPWRSAGDSLERLEVLAADLVAGDWPAADWPATGAVLDVIARDLRPAVAGCGPAELDGLLRGLDGRFVPPGPSGAPTRGRPEVLPTGRNFYSVDTRAVPTPAAWSLGRASAELLVEDYLQRHGDWPRRMALTGWGTANMRTGGDDIAQALALMGVRPTWDAAARRVTGFEILPLSALGRPRVDVTFRVSGFFRDAFPAQIDLLDSAARAVMALDEPAAENPLAAAAATEAAALRAAGATADEAALQAGYRVFGSAPGAYGAGLQALFDEGLWRDRGDLADAYLDWGGFAYGAGREGRAARDRFAARLAGVEAVVQNQDNREHDLLDSDDYYQFEGGMTAAVTRLRGTAPEVYHNDHSRPERPRVRRLEDELARIVRGRAANPKWIAGVMRHGYKGAFEIAATVDYLFAFAATTGLVKDHQFDLLFAAYLADPQVRGFMADSNPAALRETAARFQEAIDRGLWRPASNSAGGTLAALAAQTGEFR